MNRPLPIILILLIAYILAPVLIEWVTNSSSAWYKPFVIWLLVIVVAFIVQVRANKHDA